MDSGFCVLRGLVGMFEIIFYGSSLMNKQIYWPKVIYADEINSCCKKMVRMTACQKILRVFPFMC